MNVREGDPILSADGQQIVAYWARSFELAGNSFRFPVLSSISEAVAFADEVRLRPDASPPYATISARVQMPDRTYWAIQEGAPKGWMGGPYFRSAPPDPSPSPAGMVAAFDLVLSDNRLIGGMVEHDLRRVRDYWEHMAKAQKLAQI